MISIRRMTVEDVHVVRELLRQLGYPLDPSEVRRRYEAVAQAGDHALMVGERDSRVVAFCHVYARPALDKPPEAVLQALVVDQDSRRGRSGAFMMAAAETWAADRGFRSVALASSVTRSGAHAFYESIGYRREATSHLFRKLLADPVTS